MTREERELRMQIDTLKAEARTLIGENKMTEAKAKKTEIDALIEKADLLASLETQDTGNNGGGKPLSGEAKDKEEAVKNYSKPFFKMFRRKKLDASDHDAIKVFNALSEYGGDPEGADGGFLVPQDIQTQINEYKRTLPQLEPLVNVVPVSTNAGSRVFEAIASMTPLANITDDTADIGASDEPTFEQVTYAIKKYAAWLPVPNDLLNDSDQNIATYLRNWMGKKSVVTRNTLILAIMSALSPTTFSDHNGIIKAVEVTLDQMIAANAIILTNQWGYYYLDQIRDLNDHPLLQPDITAPGKMLFKGKRIVPISNSVLPLVSSTYAPFFIGDPAELVTMFERQGYMIDSTNIGGTAFRKDRTELRMIEREDVKAVDASAMIYGKINVSAIM